jgi:hypothetical protein
MFRDDRQALATQNEELRRENEQLRAENRALRGALYKQHQETSHWNSRVYNNPYLQLPDGERVVFGQHRLGKFPAWLAAVLHMLTFGVFSLFYFGSLHGSLPKLTNDDPGAGKGVGFMFIPYFNLYWMFFSPLRLVDRINLQFQLRGEEAPISRQAVLVASITSLVLMLFPYFIPLAWVFSAWQTQRAINRLVDLGPVRVSSNAQPQYAQAEVSPALTGVRVADWNVSSPAAPAPAYVEGAWPAGEAAKREGT